MNNHNISKQIEILLVEDNPGDVRLTTEALKENKIALETHVVWDGIEAMDFLQKHGKHVDAPRPDLILLDLNLPKKDGREVLSEIKADESLKRIPVIVLTTSQADEDIMNSYEMNANCFVTKPVDLDQFITIVKSIEHFWLTVVKLPED